MRRIDKGLYLLLPSSENFKVDVSSENLSSVALAKGERLKYPPSVALAKGKRLK